MITPAKLKAIFTWPFTHFFEIFIVVGLFMVSLEFFGLLAIRLNIIHADKSTLYFVPSDPGDRPY